MQTLHINETNFHAEVLNSEKPGLLDFYAPWCGPCRMVAPIVEEIAAENPAITLGKVDVDTEMELAVRFGVVSIPTLVVMENGQITGKTVGYAPKAELMKLLNL